LGDEFVVLGDIHRSLPPGGVLSITEVLPDSHYQPIRRLRRLIEEAGFNERQLASGLVSYTINVVRETAS
jgi:hypothetical protein